MKQNVIKNCQTAYFELKRISLIRRYRLDNYNSLLLGTFSCYSTDAESPKYSSTPYSQSTAQSKLHTLLQQLHWRPISKRVKYKLLACATVQSQVLPPLIFLSYCTFTVRPALSALRQTHACSNSNASTAKPMAFALSHTSAPISGTVSPRYEAFSKQRKINQHIHAKHNETHTHS